MSLFSADGHPLPCFDKSQIMHEMENLVGESRNSYLEADAKVVLRIDGMAIVNKIHNTNVK